MNDFLSLIQENEKTFPQKKLFYFLYLFCPRNSVEDLLTDKI